MIFRSTRGDAAPDVEEPAEREQRRQQPEHEQGDRDREEPELERDQDDQHCEHQQREERGAGGGQREQNTEGVRLEILEQFVGLEHLLGDVLDVDNCLGDVVEIVHTHLTTTVPVLVVSIAGNICPFRREDTPPARPKSSAREPERVCLPTIFTENWTNTTRATAISDVLYKWTAGRRPIQGVYLLRVVC